MCSGTMFALEKISASVGLRFETVRSVGQRLTTELPGLLTARDKVHLVFSGCLCVLLSINICDHPSIGPIVWVCLGTT